VIERDVNGTRRAVALVALCEPCGREVGYVWAEDGAWWWSSLRPKRRRVPGRVARAQWRTRSSGPHEPWDGDGPRALVTPVPSALASLLPPGRHRLTARCPKHGTISTTAIDTGTLSTENPRKVRARPSTTE
jgi:hypothetical protein